VFTGIIQAIGILEHVTDTESGRRVTMNLGDLALEGIKPGDSVSVNGACLTITGLDNGNATFDVSPETLDKCLVNEWSVSDRVNLELALDLQTRLGGHLVSGHVDGTGRLVNIDSGIDFTRMDFSVNQELGKFIAPKGSIAVDGVSLTTNEVADNSNATVFTVMLVPHTLANTTLGLLRKGSKVHIEVDMVARYIYRMQEFHKNER
jgi:riboflavin synthase